MTTFMVALSSCCFTLEALSAAHLFPTMHTLCEEGPIVVSRLSDGMFFVHNGRHRVVRALLKGEQFIEATSLYPDDDTSAVAAAMGGGGTP